MISKQVLWLTLILFPLNLFCARSREAIGALKLLTVKSLSQKVVGQNDIELTGEVEILFDNKIHIWADAVQIDKEKQTITARANKGNFIKLENPDFFMLSTDLFLDLRNKTGWAENIKIHVREGYISSSRAEKIDERTWAMEQITFTSCDREVPHWAFCAHNAKLYKNSVLKASGLLFKISDIPLFAFPGFVFPLQKKAGSGFLMPRLSFDAELGYGFRQEYYWFLGNHCDTTIGFNFLEKKGFVFSDEFRWARSPENFLMMNSQYAKEWNALLERKGRIISATDTHYWVQGKYFQPFSLGVLNLYSLTRFDFGTDKRIGYHFLSDPAHVEDSFYNTIIQRYFDRKNVVQVMAHSEKSLRRQFVDLPVPTPTVLFPQQLSGQETIKTKKEEREEKVEINYAPRFEWSTAFHCIIPHLFYRHDFFIDHVFIDSRSIEKLYINSRIDRVTTSSPSIDSDTSRLFYRGIVQSNWNLLDNTLRFFVEPYLQLRSNIRKNYDTHAHHKIFARYGLELDFPERVSHSQDYTYAYYIQPSIRWSCLPKFYQEHWHHIDHHDRIYPENKIEFDLRNNWYFNDFQVDLLLSQAFDFYDKSVIFPLRTCPGQRNMSPLRVLLASDYNRFHVSWSQEYAWKTLALMQSEITASLSWDKYDFFLGYLYQKDSILRERGLLSDINSFALVGCSVPLGREFVLHYDGNFFSRYKHGFPIFNIVKPTLHRVRLEYNGHCWGVAVGFEEKRYRQYGNWKSERAITLGLQLESIGSFAQRFRRPVIESAPANYRG